MGYLPLLRLGIVIYSVTEEIINSNDSSAETMEALFAALAKLDNRNKSDKTIGSMRVMLRSGISPYHLPIGYLSGNHKKQGRRKVSAELIDEERFPLIQRGLKEFTTGLYTNTSITELLNEWGLRNQSGNKISRQQVHKILTSKIYAGILVDPWSGEEFLGKHEAAISIKEFERNQFILSKKRIMPTKKDRVNPNFPLRDFVRCHVCGKTLTASNSTGHGGKYAYYRCKQKGCILSSKSINKKDLETDFLDLLSQISPSESHINLFKVIALDVWREKKNEARRDRDVWQRKLDRIQEEMTNIISLKGRELLTDAEFFEQKKALSLKKGELEHGVVRADLENWDIQGAIDEASASFLNLPALWEIYDIYKKHWFQKLVFPEGILYDKKIGLLEPTLSPIFQVLHAIKRTHRDDASLLVTPPGIEPGLMA